MFNVAWMSGSPHGVFGCTQPFGRLDEVVGLARRAENRLAVDVVVTKTAAAAAPSSTLRMAGLIQDIHTPEAP